MTKSRFAPSPTGLLHIGSARTALAAWLRARSVGGEFAMRIEDLDPPRVRPGAESAILRDLEWLGIDWDGPVVRQSERLHLYDQALERLRAFTYPCTCTRKELHAIASAPHETTPRYPRTCRNGPSHPGQRPSRRFRMDANEPFTDAIFGPNGGAMEDFILRRSDGLHAYQLAVVVDDIAMNITEVVRGADLLDSTGWQIALFRAFGSAPPVFAHVPLVVGPDGARLAKRHGSISIEELRARGKKAEEIVGFLAWTLGCIARPEPIRADELTTEFRLERIPKSAAQWL